jgi:5,10-methylenetetrahydromethanopterin reductase
MSGKESPVGLVLGSVLAPEHLKDVAKAGEELGFGRLWMAEDYYFTGGISGAATVLAATERMPVGLGVVSAVARHPALLAMEVATMARIYPGRVVPAIGLGLADWLRQMGIHPRSTLGALRESLTSMRALLAGEELTQSGENFHFDHIQLAYPVEVPLYMGIMGPKMLQLSGEVADGTVLSVGASPSYVSWAREQIAEGAAVGGRDAAAHKVSTFTLFAVDEDGDKARADIRETLGFFLETMANSSLIKVLGIRERLLELAADGPEALAAGMPDEWVEDLAVAGTPAECAEKIQILIDAGSDTVELFPVPERATEYTQLAGEQVLPRLA